MDTTTAVNTRFKIAVNSVIDKGFAKNKSAIADAMDISRSKFSEILNDRMNVGIELLVKFCLEYNANANWLLFERGELFNNYTNDNTINLAAEPEAIEAHNELRQLKKDFNELQRKLLEVQRKMNL